jgi:Flp pilus assembly pilin Flp
MNSLKKFASGLLADRGGQAIVEYGAVLACLAVLILMVFTLGRGSLVSSLSGSFSAATGQVHQLTAAAAAAH